ncbi:MAG: TetR/AcrR family transcriptional regulator [Myxococcota bacterium]
MLYEQREVEDPTRSAQQRELLECAAGILSCDGRSKLSLRKVASACDMSTQMVYTLFGGKRGLLKALHREGFRRMGAQATRPSEAAEPIDAFLELAQSYRRFALDEPNLYAAMFGLSSQSFRPREASCERQTMAYRLLEEVVETAADHKLFRSGCTRRVTDMLWALIHGTIGMEVAGYHTDSQRAEQNFIFACRAGFVGALEQRDPRDTE